MTAAPPTTLADWLLERIAEDENSLMMVAAREATELIRFEWHGEHAVTRGLAECEAKRELVRRCAAVDYAMPCTPLAHGVLRLLALPYADHDGFRDEWRP